MAVLLHLLVRVIMVVAEETYLFQAQVAVAEQVALAVME
jgi:hypothetical protein